MNSEGIVRAGRKEVDQNDVDAPIKRRNHLFDQLIDVLISVLIRR